ncbi:hypothetical protein NDQ53_16445 [Rossellomorea marisflavi]|uniref:hypothetical protein n=1 Tax=Rossellomorea marisflavi TaxID=189381 RepID=UPI00203F1BA3|nr:hypothetical protein [Rossellomorea marisflavi]MCM2590893.1 hypothetical protein [Rossellomorea marisflavi]
MSKILILTDFYHPKPLANGICIHEIALSLKQQGFEVHVLCYGEHQRFSEEDQGIFIHYVKGRFFYKLREYGENNINNFKGKVAYKSAMLINKFKKVVLFPYFPLTSPLFLFRYWKKAKEIHKENNFRLILSVFNPLEALITGMLIKKRDSSVRFGVYILDSLTNGVKRKYISKSKTEEKGWKWEKKIFNYADKIFIMKSHENHHKQPRYDIYKDKMETVDIPLFKNFTEFMPQGEKTIKEKDKDCIDFTYTGELTIVGRNPEYLCSTFLELTKNNNCKLHFYTRGNAESLIRKYSDIAFGKIIRYGYVAREDAVKAIVTSDILVSIGNEGSDMIPSKIFEYMSTGNKIIHFYKNTNDSCIFYYKKYPNALLINENNADEENIKLINEFMYSKKNNVSYSELKEKFLENTPEYTSKLIINMDRFK